MDFLISANLLGKKHALLFLVYLLQVGLICPLKFRERLSFQTDNII